MESGIVRRIDNLGRIVIPKEVRKSLKIKNGDLIEIIVKDNTIVLQKNSTMSSIEKFANEFTQIINKVLDIDIIISDRDKFLFGSGLLSKKILNQNLSKKLVHILLERDFNSNNQLIDIELTETVKVRGYFKIKNIIVNGDCFGLIILYSENNPFSDLDDKILTIIDLFLAKSVE